MKRNNRPRAEILPSGCGTKKWWVEVPLNRDWMGAYLLLAQDGAPIIGEIRIFPIETGQPHFVRKSGTWSGESANVPKGGIPARLLRELRSGDVRFAQDFLKEIAKGKWVFEWQRPAIYSCEYVRQGITGRKGRLRIFYAKIAAAYYEAWRGGSRHPLRDVAKMFKLGYSQARDAVHTSRMMGMLTKSTRGRQGGAVSGGRKGSHFGGVSGTT